MLDRSIYYVTRDGDHVHVKGVYRVHYRVEITPLDRGADVDVADLHELEAVARERQPRQRDVDPANGDVYLADTPNNRIVVFSFSASACAANSSTAFTYVTQCGSKGTGNNQFSQAYGAAVDPVNNFLYAVDWAGRVGRVASSPASGQEPVEAIRPLTAAKMKSLGLAQGEVRELGWRHPRRWLTG